MRRTAYADTNTPTQQYAADGSSEYAIRAHDSRIDASVLSKASRHAGSRTSRDATLTSITGCGPVRSRAPVWGTGDFEGSNPSTPTDEFSLVSRAPVPRSLA